MTNYSTLSNTPLADVNYEFGKYVEAKKNFVKKHLDGNGLPDYAYKMDYEYRKKLDSMPGVYKFAKTYCATVVPKMIHEYSMNGIQVGPNQYPEIYQMLRECAETLGIGIPKLIIVGEMPIDEEKTTDFNACTFAYDDVEPVIIMTGLMLERLSKEEIKVVIGHECGHIHNNHSLYHTISDIIKNIGSQGILSIPGLRQFAQDLTIGVQAALQLWSRAAEVTADRAALICSGNLKAATNVYVKFMYNGTDLSASTSSEVNIEALREQMNMVLDSPHRFNELMYSHPMSIKRVFANLDFWECEKYYEWRPDLKEPGRKLYSKSEIDERCKKYLNVIDTKGVKR